MLIFLLIISGLFLNEIPVELKANVSKKSCFKQTTLKIDTQIINSSKQKITVSNDLMYPGNYLGLPEHLMKDSITKYQSSYFFIYDEKGNSIDVILSGRRPKIKCKTIHFNREEIIIDSMSTYYFETEICLKDYGLKKGTKIYITLATIALDTNSNKMLLLHKMDAIKI